jgi:hypothetical protein
MQIISDPNGSGSTTLENREEKQKLQENRRGNNKKKGKWKKIVDR